MSNRQRARHVKDPVLLAKLTPQYPLGCKRVVISDDYLRSMGRPNASLVTGPILRIEAGGVMTGPERVGGAPVADAAAETAHNLDVLIYATGFDIVGSMDSVHVVGRDGMMIRDKYGPRGGPEAYLGITVPGLPNLCMLMGPNTGLGHSSMITMIEAQARYAAELISGAMRSGYKTVEVKEPECDAYNKELQGQLLKSVWSGCTSWYNMQGTKNIVLWCVCVCRGGGVRVRVCNGAGARARVRVRPARCAHLPPTPAAGLSRSRATTTRRGVCCGTSSRASERESRSPVASTDCCRRHHHCSGAPPPPASHTQRRLQ